MKKIIITLVILTSVVNSYSQTYFPFPTTTSTWDEFNRDDWTGAIDYYFLILDGDTTLNNHDYFNIYKYEFSDTVIIGAIREDSTKKIYFYDYSLQYEFFLYNFNVNVGDTIHYDTALFSYPYDYAYQKLIITHIDSVLFCNESYRKIFYTNIYGEVWLEGIGSYRSLLSPITPYPTCFCTRRCYWFEQNDTICELPQYAPYSINDNSNSISTECQVIINSENDKVTLTLNLSNCISEIKKIEIFDLIGNLIQTSNCKPTNHLVLSKDKFKSDIYFYRLYTTDNKILTGKFIII